MIVNFLYHVNEALERIEEGNYGLCAICKKPIPATRLKAIPHAQTCLKCQETRETKEALIATPCKMLDIPNGTSSFFYRVF